MKVIWDAEDIYAGLRVKRDRDGPDRNGKIIGYMVRGYTTDTHYCIISLDDGLVISRGMTRPQVSNWLTSNNELPIEVIGRRKAERK